MMFCSGGTLAFILYYIVRKMFTFTILDILFIKLFYMSYLKVLLLSLFIKKNPHHKVIPYY